MKKSQSLLKAKTIICLIILFLINNRTFAQTEFYKVYGNENTDYLGEIIKTDSNSFLATGHTFSASQSGLFFTKINSIGNIIWNKILGSSSSNGYTIYEFNDKVFIGGANSNNGGNAEIYCLDTSGNLIWAKEIDMGGNEDIVSISNADSNLIVIGNTNAFGNMFDISFIKIDLQGNILQSKKIGTSYSDEPFRIIKCKNNSGFVIIGQTPDSISYDAFILKVNNNGDILWSYKYGGIDGEDLSDGVELENGNFIFTGTSFSFGNVSNDGDIWVLSTDSIGNILFSKNYGKYGTDRGKRIIEINPNLFYITGETWSYGNAKNNSFLLGINAIGDVTKFETFGGNLFDFGVSIMKNNDNSVSLGGYTTSFGFGSNDFFLTNNPLGNISCYTDSFSILNNSTFPNRTIYSITDSNITFQQNPITQNTIGSFQTNDICAVLAINNVYSSELNLVIFPNPTSNNVTILTNDKNNPINEIYFIDILGKVIYSEKQKIQSKTLNIEKFPNGIYFVKIVLENGIITTRKLIKE